MLLCLGLVAPVWIVVGQEPKSEAASAPAADIPRLGFLGLHGGMFDKLKCHEKDLNIRLDHLTVRAIADGQVDLSVYRMLFFQCIVPEDEAVVRKAVTKAREKNPDLRLRFLASGYAEMVPELVKSAGIEDDPNLWAYYDKPSDESLRRLLGYVNVKYLGRPGAVEPPTEVPHSGFFNPDSKTLFTNVTEFLAWAAENKKELIAAPRVVVDVHFPQLMIQQPEVVKALIRALERRGMLTVAAIDYDPLYEPMVLEFKPDCVVHTCCTPETLEFRRKLDVPHLESIYFRQQSIEEWLKSPEGLLPGDYFFQVATGEFIGTIEPHTGGGPIHPGGSAEASTPVTGRVERLADRAVSWIRLRHKENSAKKVAFVYYDLSGGKSEIMRGTATGMFMNGPRSLIGVLDRMRREGYAITNAPHSEDELIDRLMDHGRQIGLWAPGLLDRLARSGQAVLVPAETYRRWFETKVPAEQRAELVKRWGEPPGQFLVWENSGKSFIVIPRIDLGNVILLPQPLRGEAHDALSLLHDRLVPPPHNYLATYFWLQEEFGADALVHFGTHGSEILMASKSVGLCEKDWSDILLGTMPNIYPWIINNLGEGPLARRRAYAVLISHLTPPSVTAGLPDPLQNLSNEIDKWATLEDGALKDKFQAYITEQVLTNHLDQDIHADLSSPRLLTSEEIVKTAEHLHHLYNETIPISLHVFGQPPPDHFMNSYLVTCLRKRFLDGLAEVIEVPPSAARFKGGDEIYLRKKAEEAMDLAFARGFSPEETVKAIGGRVGADGLPKKVQEGFALARELREGFSYTTDETGNLLAALNGRFIPPGPGNSPDRNPGSVPTGRNMYVMNPEEVPSQSSWELGKMLADQLIAERLKTEGRYPEKVGFWLSPFASFHDYGVMEAEILYLLGVRPVWDNRNVVSDVELISAKELGRPRLDIFVATEGVYNDMLPTRMELLDKAIRMVAELKEEGNAVYADSERVRQELEQSGMDAARSAALSRARIFGYPPGERAQWAYWYYVMRSGSWEGRDELVKAYLENVQYVYTKGIWGENAPEAYTRHIRGTEVVVKSWSDRTSSPLSGSYFWFDSGSFSLAIKYLTGREPDLVFSDVHDPDHARMMAMEDTLRENLRTRLFNPKWIEGMKSEGYAGADQVAKHVANVLGWTIMRENSISDDVWEEITDVYIRDKLDLHLKEWFDAENPYAFQEMAEIMLEAVRKDYWKADEATVLEIAERYIRSAAKHGEGGGVRGSGTNPKLKEFIKAAARRMPQTEEWKAVRAELRKKVAEMTEPLPADAVVKTPVPAAAPAPQVPPAAPSTPDTGVAAAKPQATPRSAPPPGVPEQVAGQKLEPVASPGHHVRRLWWAAGGLFLILLVYGFVRRKGSM